MTYSSALFAHAGQSLAEARRNKFRRLAEKALIGPQDHVVELGSGWGGFVIFTAKNYGCRVTGITISERRHQVARQRVAAAGLEDRVEIRLQDYRELGGRFDKIVSVEMFEALGQENWASFFRKCEDVLAPDGLVAIQAISVPDYRFDEYAKHYALTLRRWREAFFANLEGLRALGFDELLIRMWNYYLSPCEAAFETRTLGNLQLVLSRDLNRALPGVPAAAVRAAWSVPRAWSDDGPLRRRGHRLRLNHPALQLANYAVYPLQIPLILVFVRLGEGIVGATPMPVSAERLLVLFREDPLAFLARFGWTGLHGILGWLTVAPVIGGALYVGLLSFLRYTARRLAPAAEPSA